MLRYRAAAASAELVHFQWLALPQLDGALLPRARPLVLTAHDVLAREPSARAARRTAAPLPADGRGGRALRARAQAADRGARTGAGAGSHDPSRRLRAPRERSRPARCPAELDDSGAPVVLCFGLIRPYKGLDVLLEAWNPITDAQLWIVGRPRYDIAPLRARAGANVRWVTRYVDDGELAACFRRADVVVLPYREIEQSGVLATALAFASPLVLSDVGGFAEVAAAGAARLVPAGDPPALREALAGLLADPAERDRLATAARALASGEWSWQRVAERTKALYASLLSCTE
jgi:glycosyltransferase involved in cell wall biosynthesis